MAVYKRGKVWYYDIEIAGKRIKRATQATTKREAEIEAVLKSQEKPVVATGTGVTLKDAIMRCYKEKWAKNRDGLRTVNRTLKIVDILGDIPLAAVDEPAINRMEANLRELGREPATINRYRANLRRVLNVAQREWREIDRVPFIQNTKETPKRFKVYSAAEEAAILALPEEYQEFKDLATLLLDTGLRLSEALGLTFENVDFDSNLITLQADETKSMKPRSVPMTRRVNALLCKRLANPRTNVFSFDDLSALENLWRRKIKPALGVPDDDAQWVLHAMRHTFASRLVQRGVDLYTVKQLLGHSTITVTERYAHLNPARLQAAVEILNRP